MTPRLITRTAAAQIASSCLRRVVSEKWVQRYCVAARRVKPMTERVMYDAVEVGRIASDYADLMTLEEAVVFASALSRHEVKRWMLRRAGPQLRRQLPGAKQARYSREKIRRWLMFGRRRAEVA